MNTIVFVEDDPEVGALIAAYLAKHDFDVVVEPRGDLAEARIHQVSAGPGVTGYHAPW